jgi:hypothetical protein
LVVELISPPPPPADVEVGSSVVETVEVASEVSVVLLDPSSGWLVEADSSFAPVNVLVVIARPPPVEVVGGSSVVEPVEAPPPMPANVVVGPSAVGTVEVASDFSVVLLDLSSGWLEEVGSSFAPVNVLVLIVPPPPADVVGGTSVVDTVEAPPPAPANVVVGPSVVGTVEVESDFSVVLLDLSCSGWLVEVGSLTAADVAPLVSVVAGSSVVISFALVSVTETPNDNEMDIKKTRRQLKGLRNMVRTVL